MMDAEYNTIPVFIRNPEVLAKATRPQYITAYYTVTLESINTPEVLLAASDSRCVAYIFPIDDDVYVDSNRSDAAKGVGAFIKQNILGAPWPMYDNGTVYVSAPALAGSTSRITVFDVHYK